MHICHHSDLPRLKQPTDWAWPGWLYDTPHKDRQLEPKLQENNQRQVATINTELSTNMHPASKH